MASDQDQEVLEPQGSLFAPGDLPAPPNADPKSIYFRDQLVQEMLSQDALAVGAISYVPRAFTMTSLPYKQPKNADGTPAHFFVRESKFLTLTLSTANPLGLPFGSIPRLLLAHITNQAVRNQSRVIDLCHSITDLLNLFQMDATGGKTGTTTRLRTQLDALTSTTINFEWSGTVRDYKMSGKVLMPIVESALLWEQQNSRSGYEDGSYIKLSEYFYNEITKSAVPVDMRALIALRKSPLAMDLYSFFTYRMFSLRKVVTIPWRALYVQFGYEYNQMRYFKRQMISLALPAVHQIYEQLKFEVNDRGLVLYPSPTHIPKKTYRKLDSEPIDV